MSSRLGAGMLVSSYHEFVARCADEYLSGVMTKEPVSGGSIMTKQAVLVGVYTPLQIERRFRFFRMDSDASFLRFYRQPR